MNRSHPIVKIYLRSGRCYLIEIINCLLARSSIGGPLHIVFISDAILDDIYLCSSSCMSLLVYVTMCFVVA